MELMPALRAVHLAALAVLTGGFAFPLFVLRGSEHAATPERALLRAWLARLRLWAVLVALVTWVGWLLLVAVEMSGLGFAQAVRPAVLEVVLGGTRFGHVWSLRLVLILLLLGHLGWQSRRHAPLASDASALGSALAAAVLVSQVWAGHATAAPLSHTAADALHLVAAALWVGCLPPLLALLAHSRTGLPGWTRLAALAARGFTGLGTFAVLALAVTGLFNGRMMVGSVPALASTGYGRLIAAKILLFAAMLGLAAMNRFRFTPALDAGGARAANAHRALCRSVVAEIVLGLCIFAIVGVLGGSQPPAHAPHPGEPMHHPMGSADVPAATGTWPLGVEHAMTLAGSCTLDELHPALVQSASAPPNNVVRTAGDRSGKRATHDDRVAVS